MSILTKQVDLENREEVSELFGLLVTKMLETPESRRHYRHNLVALCGSIDAAYRDRKSETPQLELKLGRG